MRSLRSPLPIRPFRVAASLAARSERSLSRSARRQHGQRLGLVAMLRAVVLAFGDDAGRQVGDADRAVGLVDVLAAGAAGAEGVDAQLARVERHLFGLVGLGQDGDRAGAGVDAALRLGRRHALHAVAARLELQRRVDRVALDADDELLVAAEVARALRDDLGAPALALGIAQVHARQVGGEEGRLVAAGAGADLEEDVARVVGIARQERRLQLGEQALEVGGGGRRFVAREAGHRLVAARFGEQLARPRRGRARGLRSGGTGRPALLASACSRPSSR